MTNVDTMIDKLVSGDRRGRKAYLQSKIASLNPDQVVAIMRRVIKHPDRGCRNELLEDLMPEIETQDLSKAAKQNLTHVLEPLFLEDPFPQRFLCLQLYTGAISSDFDKVLEFAMGVLASGHLLDPLEEMWIADYLYEHAQRNCHKICNAISICGGRHIGSTAVLDYIYRLRTSLGIVKLDSIHGSILKNRYFCEIVVGGNADKNILILGRSGCGKSTFADVMYENGSHKAHPLVGFRCDQVAQQEEIVKQAITAPKMMGGTVFLDEIHTLSREKQQLLVTGLEERKIRVISASSMPSETVRAALMEDFHSRYCEHAFRIPDFSARRDDLKEVIEHEFAEHSMDVEKAVVNKLASDYMWPENYREIQQVVGEICSVLGSFGCRRVKVTALRQHLADFPASTSTREILLNLPGIGN